MLNILPISHPSRTNYCSRNSKKKKKNKRARDEKHFQGKTRAAAHTHPFSLIFGLCLNATLLTALAWLPLSLPLTLSLSGCFRAISVDRKCFVAFQATLFGHISVYVCGVFVCNLCKVAAVHNGDRNWRPKQAYNNNKVREVTTFACTRVSNCAAPNGKT